MFFVKESTPISILAKACVHTNTMLCVKDEPQWNSRNTYLDI